MIPVPASFGRHDDLLTDEQVRRLPEELERHINSCARCRECPQRPCSEGAVILRNIVLYSKSVTELRTVKA